MREAYENYDHPLRPQWEKLEKSLLDIHVLTADFRHEPISLGIILDNLEQVLWKYRGFKRTLPLGYRRIEDGTA